MAQIGTTKVDTPNGAVEVPIFNPEDLGPNTIPSYRMDTASGVGAIPLVDPSDAAFPYIRVNTGSGVKAINDLAALARAVSTLNGDTATVTIYEDVDFDGEAENVATTTLSGGDEGLNTDGLTFDTDNILWWKIEVDGDITGGIELDLVDVPPELLWDTTSEFNGSQDSLGMESEDLPYSDHSSNDIIQRGYDYGSLTRGLVGYWKFDDDSDTTVAIDSALDNDGTINGGASYATGQINQALSFDGTDDYVNIGNPLTQEDGSGFTVSGWFYFDSLSSMQGMVSQWDSNGNHGYLLRYEDTNSRVEFFIQQNDGSSVKTSISDSNFSTGSWVHFTAVGEGASGEIRLYLNGGSVKSSNTFDGTYDDTTIDAAIGLYQANSSYLAGDADEIRIYDRALSQPEIEALYNRTKPSNVTNEDTL